MDKLAELTHGAKVVLGSAIAFLIFSFFNWQEVEFAGVSAGVSMWNGIGWIAGLLAIALIAWQAMRLANIKVEVGVTPSMITAFLAVLLLLFTVIKFFADGEARNWPAWIGLILAVVICVGAWMNMQAAGEGLGDVKEKLGSMGGGGATAAGTEAPSAPAEAPSAPAADAASDAPDSKA